MKRTIEMRNDGYVYYHGKMIEYLLSAICDHFGLEDSDTHKYVITITVSKTGRYSFTNPSGYHMYTLYDGDRRVEGICKCHFKRLFFRPWVRKRYNITVKKVEIKRRSK
ncbi:MAG TPA: hypothetical protein ENH82_06655 [bacterium]|nr:hypothetical protein [bacterium]